MVHRLDRHEPSQYVGLPEVTQPPAQRRKHGNESQRGTVGCGKRDQQVQVLLYHADRQTGETATGAQTQYSHDNQRHEHQHALEKIGPAHREEAADKSVCHDCDCADDHRQLIRHAKNGCEQLAARDQPRAGVKNEKDQDERGGNDAQYAAAVIESALKIIRQGQRIAILFGRRTQRRSHDPPVEISSGQQTDHQPARFKTRQVRITREPQQKPAAHIRRLRTKRCDSATQAASTQNIIGQVFGPSPGDKANHKNDDKVREKRQYDGAVGLDHSVSHWCLGR